MISRDQSRGLDMSYSLWSGGEGGGGVEGGGKRDDCRYRREGRGAGLSPGKGQGCGEGKKYLRAAVGP